jgi:hypothetical protein
MALAMGQVRDPAVAEESNVEPSGRFRLFQQQVTAGSRGPHRQRNLHVRRQRDGHRVHVAEQGVGIVARASVGALPSGE